MNTSNQFDKIIPDLKRLSVNQPTAASKGLAHDLTIKIKHHDGGLWELVMWRGGVVPSLQEVGILVAAIRRIDDPRTILRSELEYSKDGRFCAYRIWWWDVETTTSWHQPIQREMFSNGKEEKEATSEQRHNYQTG